MNIAYKKRVYLQNISIYVPRKMFPKKTAQRPVSTSLRVQYFWCFSSILLVKNDAVRAHNFEPIALNNKKFCTQESKMDGKPLCRKF